MNLSRRHLISQGSLVLGGLTTPAWTLKGLHKEDNEPHFFIHMALPGGLDGSYLFDARPLEMTKDKFQTNYIGKEPILHRGKNGGRCWRTELVNPLMEYKDSFSIVNGVLMSPSFDGHFENERLMFSGNALGGVNFLKYLNTRYPLDYVVCGGGFSSVNSLEGVENSLMVTTAMTLDLKERVNVGLKSSESVLKQSNSNLLQYFRNEFQPRSRGGGFEKTRMLFKNALDQVPSLAQGVRSIELEKAPETGANQPEPFINSVKTGLGYLKAGLSQSLLFIPQTQSQQRNTDTHDQDSAKNYQNSIVPCIEEMRVFLKELHTTSYDKTRSMADVTTFVISSEFGRTMRQQEFDSSGTDHNPLTNSILIGGKGIRKGLVIGESDLQTSKEFKDGASGAHLEKDPNKFKIMGRPFDHRTLSVRRDRPDHFDVRDYLSANSVMNTVQSLFGVPSDKIRSDRGLDYTYPTLQKLIG